MNYYDPSDNGESFKKRCQQRKKLGIVNKFKGKSYEKQILYVNLKVRKKNYMQLHSFCHN